MGGVGRGQKSWDELTLHQGSELSDSIPLKRTCFFRLYSVISTVKAVAVDVNTCMSLLPIWWAYILYSVAIYTVPGVVYMYIERTYQVRTAVQSSTTACLLPFLGQEGETG